MDKNVDLLLSENDKKSCKTPPKPHGVRGPNPPPPGDSKVDSPPPWGWGPHSPWGPHGGRGWGPNPNFDGDLPLLFSVKSIIPKKGS